MPRRSAAVILRCSCMLLHRRCYRLLALPPLPRISLTGVGRLGISLSQALDLACALGDGRQRQNGGHRARKQRQRFSGGITEVDSPFGPLPKHKHLMDSLAQLAHRVT
ncbi:hypothetical protein SEVIR_7G082734v4 [Setaria viridis]